MTDDEDRDRATADGAGHDRATADGAGHDRATADGAGHVGADGHEAVVSQTPRLVTSWLIVGLPLAYGIYQTISKTLPLFGG